MSLLISESFINLGKFLRHMILAVFPSTLSSLTCVNYELKRALLASSLVLKRMKAIFSSMMIYYISEEF